MGSMSQNSSLFRENSIKVTFVVKEWHNIPLAWDPIKLDENICLENKIVSRHFPCNVCDKKSGKIYDHCVENITWSADWQFVQCGLNETSGTWTSGYLCFLRIAIYVDWPTLFRLSLFSNIRIFPPVSFTVSLSFDTQRECYGKFGTV